MGRPELSEPVYLYFGQLNTFTQNLKNVQITIHFAFHLTNTRIGGNNHSLCLKK